MSFVKKNLRPIVIVLSILFILISSPLYYSRILEYSIPGSEQLLLRTFFVIFIYSILFYQVYKSRKTKHAISLILEILGLALVTSAFIAIPVLYAKTAGIITEEVSYAYILQVNLLFALLLSITIHITKYISLALSKILFFLSINLVFIFNSITIAILYSTGFKIGPTVLLHFSWDAAKVGVSEHHILLLLLFSTLVPINMAFSKLLKNHKDSIINYTVISLAAIAILFNAVILNFETYKTKSILPLYSLLDTAIRYSNSNMLSIRKQYNAFHSDEKEIATLNKIGIDLEHKLNERDITQPVKKLNLITIYLESFQLNFTRYGKELHPNLTPNLNALPSDYAIYTNFINSVTPTINAMISSQCGENIILSEEKLISEDKFKSEEKFRRENNQAIENDAVANNLLKNKLHCLSDVLKNAGYYQVMMKGANIKFSGTADFFNSHGYNQTLGLKELNANKKYTDLNVWGLQDPMLIDEALSMLNTLEKKQPFNLTFLTLNSHAPGLEYSGCPTYMTGSSMLNGVHCTDYAIGNFLKQLEKMDLYKNTVILILGDHVLFNSAPNQAFTKSWYGRTYLAIRTPDESIKHVPDIFGITPDIAPTILQLLGFKNATFISGKSLLNERKNHQRITTTGFDIINNKMIPENVTDFLNDCTIQNAGNEKIHDTALYNDCQRAKIHYLQQKSIFK